MIRIYMMSFNMYMRVESQNQGTCSRAMKYPLITTTKSSTERNHKWNYSYMEANNIVVIMWVEYEGSNKYMCIFKIHENYVC
jgi:hypothetical protein